MCVLNHHLVQYLVTFKNWDNDFLKTELFIDQFNPEANAKVLIYTFNSLLTVAVMHSNELTLMKYIKKSVLELVSFM